MHFSTKSFTSLAGLAATLILTAAQASAQTATFTLPFTAHVGNATLPPGEYRLQVTGLSTAIGAAHVYHDGELVANVSVLRRLSQDANGSYLELTTVGGSRYFRTLVSKDFGAIYTFAIPHAARHPVLAKTRAVSVPVNSGSAN